MALTFSIINDEISDDLLKSLDFLKKNKIINLELRSIGGVNVLDLNKNKLKNIARCLNAKKINVSMIASPLFKWYPDIEKIENNFVSKFDLHHFNPYLSYREKMKYIKKTIEVANIFSCKKIRIFSLLSGNDTNLHFSKQKKIYMNIY